MTYIELQNALKDDLSSTVVSTFWTPTMLEGWINRGVIWATNFRPWPFTEKAEYTKSRANARYYDYPDDTADGPSAFKSDSIRLCQIEQDDGTMAEYTKLRYNDFMKYLEDNPTGTDKVFSDYRRRYFINPVVTVSDRNISVWGQEKAKELVADTDETAFSEGEETGDQAIILYAKSIALKKARRYNEATAEITEATNLLLEIWKRIQEEQSQYRTKSNALFNVPNFFK